MKMISEDELLSYFSARGNRFTNQQGMMFGLGELTGIWTHLTAYNFDFGSLIIDITTECDGDLEFIEGFKLESIDQIDDLGYTNSWMRYLNGNATISTTPLELEATLNFKIVKRKTIIFSLDLHFYDEVYEHLTLPEDFEQYLSKYERRLHAAADNRFRVNRM